MDQQLESQLKQVIGAFHLPGMAVVIVQHGEISFSARYGYANIETRQSFTPDTLCLVASVTKSFTAGLTGC